MYRVCRVILTWDFYKTFGKPLVLMGRRFFICRKDEKKCQS